MKLIAHGSVIVSTPIILMLLILGGFAAFHRIVADSDPPEASLPATETTDRAGGETAAAAVCNVPTPAPPQPVSTPVGEPQIERRLRGQVIYVTVEVDRR